MTRRDRAAVALLGLAALLSLAAAAPGQSRRLRPAAPERSPFLDGTHAFRHVFHQVGRGNRLTPLSAVDRSTDPTRTAIIVLGDPSPLKELNNRLGGLRSFVERGGALLVATDQDAPGSMIGAFGVVVDGDFLSLSEAEHGYRNMAECPYVEAEAPPFEAESALPHGEQARRIATNKPSYLRVFHFEGNLLGTPNELSAMASLPKECFGEHERSERAWLFAAGGRVGSGRALIMADHSVFINEMMLQPDNGNIDFTYRLADWLLTAPNGRDKRNQVLLYDDGEVQTNFTIPLKNLPPPPLPPPDTLMGMIDEMLPAMEQEGFFARLEEENVANQAVEDLASAVPIWKDTAAEWKLWTLAAIVASVALGLYGFLRVGTFRHRPEAGGAALAELLAKQAATGPVMEQRQEALLRDGNLWDEAREMARQLFVSAGAPPGAAVAPPITVVGPWWRRWQVRLRWRQLWRLARSPRPVRVSPRGFARLAERVRALRAALADGTVRIVQ